MFFLKFVYTLNTDKENTMSVTIWFLALLAVPVILSVYEDKQNEEYLAELKILDESYMRLLESGALSTSTSTYHEYRP